MTAKEKAVSAIQSLGYDVTLIDVIDRFHPPRKVDLGLSQTQAGDVMEHDKFMQELDAEDAG